MTEQARKNDEPDSAAEPVETAEAEVIDLGNGDGVSVSSPDTPEDVSQEPSSMLEAAQAALQEPEGTPSDPDPDTGVEQTSTDETAPESSESADPPIDLSAEPTEDELSKYSERAQERIKTLVSERNEAKQAAEKAAPIFDFMAQNDIPQQDLDAILGLTARLSTGDFAGFLQAVQPYVAFAMERTGQILPPDLQEQVKKGYVSPQIAKELAASRMQQQTQQAQSKREMEKQNQSLLEERAASMRRAVDSWEAQVKRDDLDYPQKQGTVMRMAQALMHEHGKPTNAEEALDYVKRAYDMANEEIERLRPKPRATANPSPPSTTARGGTAPKTEPTSMMEAAMQGLREAQGR